MIAVDLALAFILTIQNPTKQDRLRGLDKDCGAKCLYVLLRAENLGPSDYTSFRSQLGQPTPSGYSMQQLADMARKAGLNAEIYSMTQTDLQKMHPKIGAILHFEPGHFAVLYKIVGDQIVVLDGSTGRPFVIEDSEKASWSGKALLISDTAITFDGDRKSFSIMWVICTLLLLAGSAVFVARLWRRCVGCLCVIVLTIGGCGQSKTAESRSGMGFGHQLWLESSELQLSPISILEKTRDVEIRMENRGNESLAVDEVTLSCQCAIVGKISRWLRPGESSSIALRLDCSKVGKHSVLCTLKGSGKVLNRVLVRWSVIAGIDLSPDTLYDLTLNDKNEVSVDLSISSQEVFESSLLTTSIIPDARSQSFESAVFVASELVDERISVRFYLAKDPDFMTFTGKLKISNGEKSLALVPFRLVASNTIKPSPSTLIFRRDRFSWTAQLILSHFRREIHIDKLALRNRDGTSEIHLSKGMLNTYEVTQKDGILILDLEIADSVDTTALDALEFTIDDSRMMTVPIRFESSN